MTVRSSSPPETPPFSPLKVAAKVWGLPYSVMRDAIASGELPCLKSGDPGSGRRLIYVRHADVAEWVERRMADAATETGAVVTSIRRGA